MRNIILSALFALVLSACLGSAVRTIRKGNDTLGAVAVPAYQDAQAACAAAKAPLVEAGEVLALQKAIDACNATLEPLERIAVLQKQIDEALDSKDVEHAAALLDEALALWRKRAGK